MDNLARDGTQPLKARKRASEKKSEIKLKTKVHNRAGYQFKTMTINHQLQTIERARPA